MTARAAVQPATAGADEARPDEAGISTVARRGTLNLVGACVSGLLNFALVVIVTRTLHTVGAGLFFEATSVFVLAGAAASFGSDTALVRFISQDRAKGITEHIRRHIMVAVVPSAFFALIIGALLFWLAPELASYFEITPGLKHNPEFVLMIRVLAVFLPVYVTYLNGLAATVGFGSMVPTNVVDRLMTSALQPIAVFIAADLALGGGGIVAAWAAPILLGLIPIYLWLRRLGKKAGVRLDPGGSRHTVPGTPGKDFWFFAAPRGVASIFQIGQDRIGILLVGALSTAAAAGVFAAAARWLIAGNVFADALNLGIQPTMAEHLARRDYASAGRLYQVTTGWMMLVSGPIYLSMAIFPAVLLRPFGNGFDSGAPALTVLAIGTFAAAATGSVTVILLMGGKSSWNLFNTSVALGADVVIGVLLIPHLGLIGAAISTDVALLIANVLPVIQVHGLYGMHPFGRGFWVALTASLGCFALIGVPIRLLIGQSLPAALTYAFLSCSAYALVIWLKRDALQLTRLSGMVSGQLRWHGHLYHRQRPQDHGPTPTFRRQLHQEIATVLSDLDATERSITELYTKAVEELGSDKVRIRRRGLYALERLAQDNPAHRQTIVNVICAYLRMPFSPTAPTGKSEPEAAEGRKEPGSDTETRTAGIGDAWHHERRVRLSAQRILEEHLRDDWDEDQQSTDRLTSPFWPNIRLDLTGATLIDFSLVNAVMADTNFHEAAFSGDARFGWATFGGDARFDGAVFSRGAQFGQAVFSGDAQFGEASFRGDASFDKAAFSGDAWFDKAAFSGDARFGKASFSGDAWFDKAAFSRSARFRRAVFSRGAWFGEASFRGDASFDKAAFSRGAQFGQAVFSGDARFGKAAFSGDAWFDKAAFSRSARFRRAVFSGDAWFGEASFRGDASFDKAAFSRGARFGQAVFSGDARFGKAILGGEAWFDKAAFSRSARFRRAAFSRGAGFGHAAFSGDAQFDKATFIGHAGFDGATFSGGEDSLSFQRSRVLSPDSEHVWPAGWCLMSDARSGFTVVRAKDDDRA